MFTNFKLLKNHALVPLILLFYSIILVGQLNFELGINFQDNEQNAILNTYPRFEELYSTTDELPIANIILNQYFLHDTILSEMEISYLGTGFQNETNEHISIAGEIENLIIESTGQSVLFSSEFNSQINQSELYFTLNDLIPKGQYLILSLQWEKSIPIEISANHNISVYWNKEIGISAMKVVLSQGYSYVGSSNPPDQVKSEDSELILRWTEIFKDKFTAIIQTLYQEPYFEEQVSITPLEITIVETENKIINFTFAIENGGNSTLQVKIISGDEIYPLNTFYSLIKPFKTNYYSFECDLRDKNTVQSNVTFQIEYFNGTQIYFLVPVHIFIQNNIDLLLIGAILFIIFVTFITVFFAYKNRKKISTYIFPRKNQISNGLKPLEDQDLEDPGSSLNNIIAEDKLRDLDNSQTEIDPSKIIEIYKTKLKAKELEVFDLLLKNPFGHSQAELCELTGISKATMSRIVSQLELLQMVDREKSGMSKIVKVRNKFL